MLKWCASFSRNVGLRCLAVVLLLGFNGCAWLVAPPQEDGPARALLEQLQENNSQLYQFKGLLHASMEAQGRSISGRVAWAAAAPDRLRLEWLNPIGQPLTSLAGNGEYLTVLSHLDSKRYLLRQTPTVLEKLIHVPIGIEDLLTLLSGRPLVPEFHAVQHLGDPGEGGIRLVNRWRFPLADLKVDDRGRILSENVYAAEGELLYRIQWKQWMIVDGFTLPQRFRIDTVSGRWVDIRIDRFMTDVDLDPSMFELSLSESS